ncbi:tripartite motif-containing protein 35 [Oryzias latipes]|uniref:Tripartite motif containing 35-28 n=1 Tax=Oryzias latipes TaxID=8090 RepID=H2MED1_ORYLA|nr:tripartite motif-containing protein 35 [Oryzias latipes]XP_023820368.1 tripartite motif-containing protein 35 [Oryzias latipes]
MMAENMDEDMPEESPLQQDLSCPVCQGIYDDPLMLPCSHSFCRRCLLRCWEQTRKCPICRTKCEESQAVSNRALKSACQSFLSQAVRTSDNQNRSSVEVCNIHLKPLELYCEKDEEPVCVECVPLHSAHRLLSLKQGESFCKQELEYKDKIFEKKMENFKKMKLKFNNAMEYVKVQAGEAERQIKAEFERLHAVLTREEALCLDALASDETKKIEALQSCMDSLEKDIKKLEELMEGLKKDMQMENLPLLKDFRVIKRKAQWTKQDPSMPPNSLINISMHVGSLGFKIWKKMQADVTYYPVILDPNSASPWLSLNADLTSAKESPERLSVPENLERFDPCVFVLGAEGYTSGKHKWDIFVGNIPKWTVGVCKESVLRKKKFTVSPGRGVWAIGLSKEKYIIHTAERNELPVEQGIEKIRIKLNMDKGEVSFWDAGTAKHLVTLTHKFEEKMFPLFGPGLYTSPMELPAGKIAVHTS